MHRRKPCARYGIGHAGTQVRVHNLRASNAHNGAHLLLRHVADFKNSGLLGFYQKHRAVTNFGGHGGGDRHFKNTIGHRLRVNAQLNVNRWLLLL